MVLIKRWGVLMKKIYVVDTNVMIQAPYALYCFDEHDVVLPMVVVEELDQLKRRREREVPMQDLRFVCWKLCDSGEIFYQVCLYRQVVRYV